VSDSRQASAEAFDRFARDWDEHHGPRSLRGREFAARLRYVRRRLRDRECVVDVGCGTGQLLIALARDIDRGVGLDFSQEMVNLAERNARARGAACGNIRFVRADAAAVPAELAGSRCVDTALFCGVIEHLPSPVDALAAWRRELSPRGRILVISPDNRGPGPRIDRFLHGRPFRVFDADWSFSPASLRAVAAQAGLRAAGVGALPCVPRPDGARGHAWLYACARLAAAIPHPALRGCFAVTLVPA